MAEDKKPVFINTSSFNDIQAKLDKKLGPEYISKRVGFGSSRVAYIEGWRAINLANQIFGYNGWSTEVKSVVVDFLDERQGKFCVGCTAIVRVTLSNGTFREDIGYGTVENERRKAAAFERAKKSAVTDALKRSLRSFGNALGNCLYDKSFLAKIDKVKFDPPDFDENNLFRPSDEISEVSRAGTIETEAIPKPAPKRRQLTKVGGANVPSSKTNINSESSKIDTTSVSNGVEDSTLKNGITKEEQDDLLDDSLMFSDDFQDEDFITNTKKDEIVSNPQDKPSLITPGIQAPLLQHTNDPITFVTGKGATSLQAKRISKDAIFDPKYQAQSIKHTIDQTTSKHVPASVLKDKPPSRENLYQQFAPKGKGLPGGDDKNEKAGSKITDQHNTSPQNSTDLSSIGNPPITNSSILQKNTPTKHMNAPNNFAPPTPIVVHPNSYSFSQNHQGHPTPTSHPTRREVGRPKVNPLQMRKTNP